jgi:spore maturation protein CgeB
MQGAYIEPREHFLPYAVAPWHSYPMDLEKEYDVCMIGLQYEHRIQLQQALERLGYSVKSGIGIVFDEYREAYNKSRVSVSWSSLNDLPNRVWEAFGMSIPLVCNRLSDMGNLFVENEHYLGFSSLDEAIRKVELALSDYDNSLEMAHNAYRKVMSGGHTWDDRIQTILEVCKLV